MRYVHDAITGKRTELPDLPPVERAPAEVQAEYIAKLDEHIDSAARARGYDNRVTCAMRAGYAGPYQAECLAFAQWMDDCYQRGTKALAAVLAGKRQMPTPEAFFAELPEMVWPEAVQ
ncbi:MAG TPA: hypothetical protein DCY64_22535 [Hydrogenophaga sp.]|uniref:hypothetical protein n=1 Tax=Hydrogenophaga sp. TaxID=1904254 RepID=UPI0008D7F4EF|nr:hypothetical protein [Hydrogenophaga sp.]OGA78763.1 MAG: hypothetical protein A2X73_07375 [Burkholderiales bacterium GWE1_65_30]HAX23050.1 hypothetical protein [Hydrogenophaga sp.]HBU17086.1 hypothetical protein [Hydrogenophaga sp.]